MSLLPHTPRVYHIAKLYFSYDIFVTYLVQYYVPMDFLEPPLVALLGYKCEYLKLTIFRTVVVLATGNWLVVATVVVHLHISFPYSWFSCCNSKT